MFETSRILFNDITRNLFKKMKTSPILYMFFSAMLFFSVIMFAFLTFFLLNTETIVNFMDVFFTVFFLFLLKSAADLHTYFITAPQPSYMLSTQRSHERTVGQIVLTILFVNMGLWFSFSLLYLLVLSALHVSINYPTEYLLFSLNIMSAVLIGCTFSLHFFSSKQYRMIPTLIFILFLWYAQSLLFVACLFPLVLLHFGWSLRHSLDSYRFVKRKERIKEKAQVHLRGTIRALFYRETTVIWRERLFFSFISMSIFTAFGTGYLFKYGTDLFIPEPVKKIMGEFLPTMFVFLGSYIVIMYTAVFPSLNLFLTEEKTMWILKNLPVKNESIVYGKTLTLGLCFLTTIPYLAFIPFFVGASDIPFLFWFLSFSFLFAVIVAVPLGAKYVGKKSDILLLYSVAMVLFVFLSMVGTGMNFLRSSVAVSFVFILCILLLLFEFSALFLSLKLSARILSKQ